MEIDLHSRVRELVTHDMRTADELSEVELRAATSAELDLLANQNPAYREHQSTLVPTVVATADQLHAVVVLPAGGELASLVQRLADEVQGVLVGTLIFRAWPKCPNHEHQLTANEEHGQAVWVCPQTHESVSEVGSYADV